MTAAATAVDAITRLFNARDGLDAREAAERSRLVRLWSAAGIRGYALCSKGCGSFDSLSLWVDRKLPVCALSVEARIPRKLKLESIEAEVQTDVVTFDSNLRAHGTDQVVRPVQPGTSVSVVNGSSGTLGAFVSDTNGDVFLLSCSHVLARSGQLKAPFDELPPAVKRIQQPLNDDGRTNNIGSLINDFTPLMGIGGGMNAADIALARLDDIPLSPIQFSSGKTMLDPPNDQIRTGIPTTVLGARSRQSSGVTTNANTSLSWLIRDVPFIGDAKYTGMVLYTASCVPGDSGAGVVDDNGRLLGIHVGGSTQAGVGVFFPVSSFLAKRDLHVVSSLAGGA